MSKEPKATDLPADTRVARIRTLVGGVSANDFTFGRDQTVENVPLAHAEYLKGLGQVEILEVA